MTNNPDDLLRRELGVRQLAASIFNYTIGSGIFVMPALVAAQLGPAAILAYLVCGAVMALFVSSPFGYTLRGIRENESRMKSLDSIPGCTAT